jgi:hypothetical protein
MWTQKITNDSAISTEKPQPLDNTNYLIDNDGRECERWKESQQNDPIVVEKAKVFSNLVGLIL